MALQKIQLPRKVRPEDYPEDSKEAFGIFADGYNQFLDDVYRSLSFPDKEIVTYTVNIGSGATLINPSQIKPTLISKIRGLNVINAINVNSPTVTPISHPFISWSIAGNGLISISAVTGLQSNSQYILTIELIS